MADCTVVIVDSVSESLRALRDQVMQLDGLNVVGEAEDCHTGYELIHQLRPQIVLMELGPSPDETFAAVQKTLEFQPRTHIILVLPDVSPDAVVRAMRAGARDVLARPVDPDDLATALAAGMTALQRHQREEVPSDGHVVTVFSSKGGLGTTAVACNLAVALSQQHHSVVLVSVDLRGGDTALFFDLQPTHTIFDVSQNIARADAAFLRGCLSEHESGVHILAEPYEPEAADLITAAQITQILRLLKSMYQFIIVDTTPGLNEQTMAALDVSDTVMMLLMLSVPSIRSTQRTLDVLTRLRFEQDRVRLAVNRYDSESEISIKDLEETLRHPIWWQIPNDFFAISRSVNQGIPAMLLAPDSKFSRNMHELGRQLMPTVGGGPVSAGNVHAESRGGFLRFLRGGAKKGDPVA